MSYRRHENSTQASVNVQSEDENIGNLSSSDALKNNAFIPLLSGCLSQMGNYREYPTLPGYPSWDTALLNFKLAMQNSET